MPSRSWGKCRAKGDFEQRVVPDQNREEIEHVKVEGCVASVDQRGDEELSEVAGFHPPNDDCCDLPNVTFCTSGYGETLPSNPMQCSFGIYAKSIFFGLGVR